MGAAGQTLKGTSMTNDSPNNGQDLAKAYITYARFIVFLALAMAAVLPLSSVLDGEKPEESLSHYYWTDKDYHRNLFVGVLCAVAVFLLLYKGLRKGADEVPLWNEAALLNVAGVATLGVAFFPVDVEKEGPSLLLSPHTLFAGGLFFCLFLVGVVLPPKADVLSTKRTRTPYVFWSVGMILGALSAFISVLVAEILLLASFAAFWYFRTRELGGLPAVPFTGRGKAGKPAD